MFELYILKKKVCFLDKITFFFFLTFTLIFLFISFLFIFLWKVFIFISIESELPWSFKEKSFKVFCFWRLFLLYLVQNASRNNVWGRLGIDNVFFFTKFFVKAGCQLFLFFFGRWKINLGIFKVIFRRKLWTKGIE